MTAVVATVWLHAVVAVCCLQAVAVVVTCWLHAVVAAVGVVCPLHAVAVVVCRRYTVAVVHWRHIRTPTAVVRHAVGSTMTAVAVG